MHLNSFFYYRLGKGDISFWFDPWLEGKSVGENFPLLNNEDTDIPKQAKVRDYWRQGN